MNDKVKKALEERKKRLESGGSISKPFSSTSNDKVKKALEERQSRISKDLDSIIKDIDTRYKAAVEAYNNDITESVPTWGSDTSSKVYKSQSDNRLSISKIRDDVEAYGKYLGEDEVKKIIESLDMMGKGYDSVYEAAKYFSQFETEEEYKYKDYSYFDIEKEIADLQDKKSQTTDTEGADKLGKTIDWLETYMYSKDYASSEEYDEAINSIDERLNSLKQEFYGAGVDATDATNLDATEKTKRLGEEIRSLETGRKSLELKRKSAVSNEEIKAYENEAMAMPDFNEKSAYTPLTAKTDAELEAEGYKKDAEGKWYKSYGLFGSQRETYTGEDDDLYTYINKPEERMALEVEHTIDGVNFYVDNGYNTLNEQETATYNYLYATDKNKANEYIEKLKPTLQRRAMQKEAERYAEASEAIPIIMSAMSVGTNFQNAMMLPGKVVATATGQYDENPWLDTFGNRTQAIRGTVEENAGDFGGLLYSGAMSLADMGLALAVSGGSGKITQAIMSSSAGSSTLSNAKANGASDGKALMLGLGSAAIEWATEKYSVEALLSEPTSILGYLAKNTLTEGAEEGASNLANIALDGMVSTIFAEKTEIQSSIDELVLKGIPQKEATKQVLLGKLQELGEDVFVGGLTGAGMSSVMLGAGTIGAKVDEAESRKQTGMDITDNKRVDELVDIVRKSGDAKLMALAEEVAGVDTSTLSETKKNAYAKKVGKLYSKTQQSQQKSLHSVSTDTVKNIVVEKLKAKGVDESIVDKSADAIVKTIFNTDKALTVAEGKLMKQVGGEAIVNEIVKSEEVGIEIDKAQHDKFGQILETKSLTKKKENAFSNIPTVKKEVSTDGLVSESGKTTRVSTGEEISINKDDAIASIKTVDGENKVFFNTNQGVVESSDISYADESEALIYESFTDMNPTIASAAIKAYDGSIPVQTYIDGMREGILLYGKLNFQEVGKDISRHSDLAELSSADQALALKLGREVAKIEKSNAEKAIQSAKEKASKDTAEGKKTVIKGKVSYENGVKAETRSERRAVALAKHLASAIGIDIVFYDARTTKGEGAKANGYYDPNTDTIHLDLQKSVNDSKTIAFTLSHELVHFVKKYSPAKFQIFADFLMQEYASHGVSTSTLLSNKMAELGTDDADLAYEEMIADSCERMLLDSNVMLKLAKLKKIDLDLFEKIRLHILDLLNKIRDEYKKMNYAPQSEEAKALLAMEDVIGKLHEKFEEMVVDAAENFQAIDTESVKVSEDGTIMMQMKQYETTGRDTLLKYLRQQYGNDNANDLISTMDNLYNAMAELKKDTALSVFGNWQEQEVELDENGHPIFTTSIKNGDYILNQDFSRVCKKRRQLNFVLNMLAEDPAFEASNLTKDDIVKINQAIKKHGFEIACALCFVDSKRFRQTEWADSFANTWNDILYSVVGDKSKLTPFNFATSNPNINDDGIEIDTSKPVMYRKWSDGKEDVKNRRNHDSFDRMLEKDAEGSYIEGNSNVRAIVKIIKENPHLRHTFRGADIIASDGFDTIQRLAPNIRSILDGWGGTSVPKPSSNDAIYDNSVLNIDGYNAEKAFAIGGVRMNSFSDFMAHMFFDYAQAFADLSAKGLPMHSYTKELDFARLFGLTKGKINMSAIAAIRENATDLSKVKGRADKDAATKWEKSIAGLDISKLADKLGKAEADITYDDVAQNLDDCEYVWADESIDVKSATLLQSGIMYDNLTDGQAAYCYELVKEGKFDEAFKIAGEENVNREYAKHLGIITVGVSKAHILKLMRDPTIRMVIPYHKSGLNAQVAKALKILFYEDFTDVQNTMLQKADGKTVGLSKDGAKIKGKNIRDFNFYDYFGKTIDGVFYDGKATASKYIEWCENGEYNAEVGEYGYYLTDGSFVSKAELDSKGLSVLPKFNEFAEEENYYKLIEDFDCYDTITGEHSSQEAVDFLREDGLPADYKNVLKRALKAEQKVSDDFKDHLDNQGLRDEIMEIVGANGYTPSFAKGLADVMKTEDHETIIEGMTDIVNIAKVKKQQKKRTETYSLIGKDLMYYEEGNRPPDLTPVEVINERTGAKETTIKFVGDKPKDYVPKKIAYCYKLFEQHPDGTLHPLFAGARGTAPIGEWQFAQGFPYTDEGVAGMNLRERYGWHLSAGLPSAPHLMSSKYFERGYPSKGQYGHPKNSKRVWVRMAYDASQDFNSLADTMPKGDVFGLIPFGGYYAFKENNHSEWVISSAVKIEKILTEEERQQILEDSGYDEYEAWRYRFQPTDAEKAEKQRASKERQRETARAKRLGIKKDLSQQNKEMREAIASRIIDNPELSSKAKFQKKGKNAQGIEVYETSQTTMDLTWDERITAFEGYLNSQFENKTARFVRNGHTYHAKMDKDFFDKVIYGEKHFSQKGKRAFIKAGADGDVFDLIENAEYDKSKVDTKNHKKKDGFTDYFDYFFKTVQIDGRVFDILVNVKKQYGTKDGYTYTLFLSDNKKIKASPFVSTQGAFREKGNALSEQRIPQDKPKVKKQLKRDSNGKELSLGQQEYFKDSKVRDAEGNLKVMYHGTPNGDFTTFRIADGAHSSLMAQYGAGYYFDENRESAKRYTQNINKSGGKSKPKVFEVYLDIRNPLEVTDTSHTITKKQLADVISRGNYEWFFANGMPFELTKWLGKSKSEIQSLPRNEIINHWVDKTFKEARYDSDILSAMVRAFRGDSIISAMKEVFDNDGIRVNDKYGEMWIAWDANQIKEITNLNPTKDSDIRFQKKRNVEPITNDDIKKAVSHFGTTTNFDFAGYLLTNGMMLDFSGKHWGNSRPTGREVDHRDVLEAFNYEGPHSGNNGVDAMIDMIGGGNIRLMPEVGGINLAVAPNEAQRNVLLSYIRHFRGEIIVDIDEVGGDTIHSFEYNKGTAPMTVIRDIMAYFEDGTIPKQQPEYRQFLYQKKKPTNRELLSNALESTIDTSDIDGILQSNIIQRYKESIAKVEELESHLAEVKKEIYELSFRKGSRDMARLRELREDKVMTENRINTYDRRLLEIEATKPMKDLLKREKEMVRKRYEAEGRVRVKKALTKKNESLAFKKERENLQKLIFSTAKWLESPGKNDVKCPDMLRKPFADFLASIDTSSKSLLKKGEATRNDYKFAMAMDSLATAIERIKTAQDPNASADGENKSTVELGGYLDLPENFAENIRIQAEGIKSFINLASDGDSIINDMSSDELKELSKIIKILKKSITEMQTLYTNYRFSNAQALGRNTMEFADSLGESKDSTKFKDFTMWDNTVPYYAFKRFGEGGESIFESLMDSQDKLAFHADEILKFKEKNWTEKEVSAWGKDTHTINLPSGRQITLTTADAMSIYCLSRRFQGKQHLVQGGVRVVGLTEKGKKSPDVKANLANDDVDAIGASLTDRQREVAQKIQEFMSTVCSQWGNEIWMKRFLTTMFNEQNYFPIESDPNVMDYKDPTAKQSDLFRLLNISATKPLTEGANNRVVIRNIFDVFSAHSSDMARLNAYGMSLLDYMKWLNYREKSTNVDSGEIQVVGVRNSLDSAYGSAAMKYIVNLIKDINGSGDIAKENAFAMQMMRGSKTAAVGANIRVALLQLTALPRASLVLSPRSIALGVTKKPSIAKAKKYCGMALWKSFGFYDTNISKSIESQIKGDRTVTDKIIEASLKGAELGDSITWGYLWNACEYEVAKSKKYKVGTEEFNKAVAEKLREVIYASQVVDSTLTRSQMMRNKSGLNQMLSAFMSEPTLTYNVWLDALSQFNNEKRRTGNAKAAWKNTKGVVTRSISTIVVTSLVVSLAEALADAFRDDDDEPFGKKFIDALWGSFLNNINPLNKIPVASDIVGLVEDKLGYGYFSSDRLDTQYLTTLSNAYDAWLDIIMNGKDAEKTLYYAIYNTTKATSQFTGLPISNVMREVVTLWNNTAGAYDITLKVRNYDLSNDKLGEELFEAMAEGNSRQAERLKLKFDDEEKANNALKNVIKQKYEDGEINASETEKHLKKILGMTEEEIYWQMDKWNFNKETGSSEGYSKYDDFLTAVETGKNIKAVIKEYTDNGVDKKTLASQITKHFKPLYIEMSNNERASLKGYLLNAYALLGYDRSEKAKDIKKWLDE